MRLIAGADDEDDAVLVIGGETIEIPQQHFKFR
jgi:hypothetical protein